MIEEIHNGEELMAIIIRKTFSKDGIEFFTPYDYAQQVGYMKRPKGYIIKPHVHYRIPRKISTLQEVLFVKRGKIRVDFFSDDQVYIISETLEKGDFIILISGGHGFKMLEETEIVEVKQGPYLEEKDKEKFDPVDDARIILKNE